MATRSTSNRFISTRLSRIDGSSFTQTGRSQLDQSVDPRDQKFVVAALEGFAHGPTAAALATSGDRNRQLFTGHEYDQDSGLYYAKARYLDPESGRFISRDSYLGEASNPQSLHRYAYAHSNPGRFTDPTGHYVSTGEKDENGRYIPSDDAQILLAAPGGVLRSADAFSCDAPQGFGAPYCQQLTFTTAESMSGAEKAALEQQELVSHLPGDTHSRRFWSEIGAGVDEVLGVPERVASFAAGVVGGAGQALREGLGNNAASSWLEQKAQTLEHAGGSLAELKVGYSDVDPFSGRNYREAQAAAEVGEFLVSQVYGTAVGMGISRSISRAAGAVRSGLGSARASIGRGLDGIRPRYVVDRPGFDAFAGHGLPPIGRKGHWEVGAPGARGGAGLADDAVTPLSRQIAPTKTVPNAAGKIISFTTRKDQFFYRVYSGDSKVGSFLTSVKPRSAAFAEEALALPPGNSADFVQRVLVPGGTRMQRSRAAPAFGRRGGAEQFQLLERIPVRLFGPGKPLAK